MKRFLWKLRGLLHQCTPAGQRDVRECRRLFEEERFQAQMRDKAFEEHLQVMAHWPTSDAKLKRMGDLYDIHQRHGTESARLIQQWNVVAARLGIDPV